MKTVWILNTRNDYYSENNIQVYAKKDDAIKIFKEIIEDNKDEREFSYDEDNNEASWEYHGYFCAVSVWEEGVR